MLGMQVRNISRVGMISSFSCCPDRSSNIRTETLTIRLGNVEVPGDLLKSNFSEMEETKSLLEWIQEIIGKIGLGDS